jgi:uncharacterized membrane protein
MPYPRSTAQISGHPIHPMLIPFPVVFLVTAFATDIAFWITGGAVWATASMWLLGAGVIMALVAAVFGFTDFFGSEQVRNLTDAWLHMAGNLIAVVLAAINWYLRYSTDPTTGVFPAGFWISLATVLLLLFNGWKGWELVYRHHVGVADEALPSQPAERQRRAA